MPAAVAQTPGRIPPRNYIETMTAAIRNALDNRQGVALWTILTQIHADGYHDFADAILRSIVEQALSHSLSDTILFARLINVVLEVGKR